MIRWVLPEKFGTGTALEPVLAAEPIWNLETYLAAMN